ncbi:DUF6099 family protein [Streptomyces sp. NBC_01754]|uniref:DUF6099 family protein n=1 Tax=Streptomyces sp. NBC_01754 TaxID=2975930 RepID=UPI002DDB59A7|nr:DUF6099 family protein [Streptomyces sp. NBC_01754]WSC95461.1 DUF6099 family protein [Streptomyces sp. NBC_01754]
MEAERLIEAGRRALAASRGAPAVMAEAWQAQALARTVGGRLARCGPAEVRSEARELSEIGGLGTVVSGHPAVPVGEVRASLLTEVTDTRAALTALGCLLGEVGIALVGVACDTEDGLYWQCIEAIDAVDESVDRVHAMLRRLAELPPPDHGCEGACEHAHEREGGPPHEREPGRGRDGPREALRGRTESRPITS